MHFYVQIDFIREHYSGQYVHAESAYLYHALSPYVAFVVQIYPIHLW